MSSKYDDRGFYTDPETGETTHDMVHRPTTPDGPVNSPSVFSSLDEQAGDFIHEMQRKIDLLIAHLVTKGYGHATIKRILKGEVVR